MTGKVPKWRLMLAAIDAAGPAGITPDKLAQACGMSLRSLHSVIDCKRREGVTNAGSRMVSGVLTYFSAQHRPPSPKEGAHILANLDAMRKMIADAAPGGVPRSQLMAGMTESQFKRRAHDLLSTGQMFRVLRGVSDDEVMHFMRQSDAAAFLKNRKSIAEKLKTLNRAPRKQVYKPRPRAQKPAPVPFVLKPSPPKKANPVEALKAAPVVNPRGIKPVVYPTPAPRFHVDKAPQHISANDCRPWARYA